MVRMKLGIGCNVWAVDINTKNTRSVPQLRVCQLEFVIESRKANSKFVLLV